MDTPKFKQSLIAATIAAMFATNAYAQQEKIQEPVTQSQEELTENEVEEVEVIEVTGIRASLLRSMDLKRESKGIVDGISAEDIGKFPDANLAESLQRITGIAIERDRGEGSKITVRGFGPDFNLVTFNGRQMPTTGGRSFDFGNIASEGISSVEVYKSGRANVPTGGIGAVVNVSTTKPLKRPGQHGAFSVKGVYDPGTKEGDRLTPEFASVLSKTFFDDTFGLGISFSHQERDGGTQSATTQDFMSRNFVSQEAIEAYTLANPGQNHPDNEWGTIVVGSPNAVGFPDTVVDGIYAVPTNIQYNIDDFTRTRTNAQLTLQWKPIDTLTASVDYTYAENEFATEHKDISAWFDPGCSKRSSEWVKEGNIYSPVYYGVSCDADRIQGVGRYSTIDENKSLGINLEWQPIENFVSTLDYHDSSGETRPNSKWGSSGFVAVASMNRISAEGYFSDTGMPVLNIGQGERNSFDQIIRRDELDLNDIQLSGSGFGSHNNRMDVEQAQLHNKYSFDDGHSIEFGGGHLKVTNRGQSAWVARNAWSGVGSPGDIADLLRLDSMEGVFDGVPGSNDPRLTTDFITWDFESLIQRAEELLKTGHHGNIENGGGPCKTGFCPTYDYDLDEVTEETTISAYIQGHYVFELANMFANLYVGLRYEETEVHSEALVPLYDRIEWSIIDNNFNLYKQLDEDGDTITGFSEIDGEYDMLLPSIDFDIELTEELILRAAYSQTITRPHYNDLKGALIIDWFGADGGGGRRGNPQLSPMESDNIDISLEWYYGDVSYASIGYWTKDVDGFIVSRNFEDQPLFDDLKTPIDGALYNEAIEEITGGDPFFEYDNEDVANYFSEYFGEEVNVIVEGEGDELEVVVIGAGDDPTAEFDVWIPVNENSTTVDGWEFALQHTFGESGYGMQVNYTIVDGDLVYDINKNEDQWVVPGMSDTANLVAFYEKDGLHARIAYNWRDEYLQASGRDPRFVEEYWQIDASLSYEFGENLTVFAEALNITEEDQRVHGRSKYQLRAYNVGHARYNLGLRYNF